MNPAPAPAPARLASIDAYRGFVMLLMMAEVLRLRNVARALPESSFWKFLSWHQTHVEWVGCTLHDLIQPSFSFLVGVALPFSIAARMARGDSPVRMTLHAAWRALLLVLLGVFLRSVSRTTTYWTFEDTLSQIGLGYVFLFALGFRPWRDQWIAFSTIVVGYFTAFALYPLPAAGFDPASVGLRPDWLAANGLTGFAAHWQKNTNLAWAFDTWWLNLFPRERPFAFHPGGYATLSFIPTLGTMILGLIAGGVLRSERAPGAKLRWFAIAGAACLLAGAALGWLGVCPVVKRIWTPSWVLYSGGWCLLLLALFHLVLDLREKRGWAFPLLVIGANSIAAYCLAHGFDSYVSKALTTHFRDLKLKLGGIVFHPLRQGSAFEPLFLGLATLAILWLILWWMYRRKIFVRL